MADFHLRLTPALLNMGTEGSLDTSILNGSSVQRTGYLDVYNGTDRKIVETKDGETFNDTMVTWSDNASVVAE